jgi:predicted nucleic acid-binding protein
LNLSLIGTAAMLFMAQRKGLITNAEDLITVLNQVGYRISAQVVGQLKQQLSLPKKLL